MDMFILLMVNGIILGSTYCLVAIGLTMIYGTMKILHIAHASSFVLGAMLGLFLAKLFGNIWLSFFVTLLLSGIFGLMVERIVYRPLLALPRIVPLIASIGLFVFLRDLFRIISKAQIMPFDYKLGPSVSVAGLKITGNQTVIIFATAIFLLIVGVILRKTRVGFSIKAVAQDLEAATIVGISPAETTQAVFFIGSAISAGSGFFTGVYYNLVESAMGDMPSYKALAVIVLGGFGSIPGTIVGGLLLGVAETFSIGYLNIPLSRDGLAMAILIIVILLKPEGIFGKR